MGEARPCVIRVGRRGCYSYRALVQVGNEYIAVGTFSTRERAREAAHKAAAEREGA